jgi:Domain of unknown function (DUF4352)
MANNGGIKVPSRRQLLFIVTVAGVFLIVIGTLEGCNGTPNDASPNTGQTSVSRHHRVNEKVQIGYWSYTILNWQWADAIGAYPFLERPDAKFLILDMAIENDDRSASTLPPIKLVDSLGREFEESSKSAPFDTYFGPLKSLNPGVTSRGRVAFDVPVGKYAVVVPGGFESSETAIIDLGSSPVGQQQRGGNTPDVSSQNPQDSNQPAPKNGLPKQPSESEQSTVSPGTQSSESQTSYSAFAVQLQSMIVSRGFQSVGHALLVDADADGNKLVIQRAICANVSDGRCQKLFIAFNGRFLGTDTSLPSWAVHDVARERVGSFSALYEDFSDLNRKPSPIKVVYTWDGQKLTASGTPPTRKSVP